MARAKQPPSASYHRCAANERKRVHQKEREERAEALLAELSLNSRGKETVRRYSGGMAQLGWVFLGLVVTLLVFLFIGLRTFTRRVVS